VDQGMLSVSFVFHLVDSFSRPGDPHTGKTIIP
jgi:hypothetical protein